MWNLSLGQGNAWQPVALGGLAHRGWRCWGRGWELAASTGGGSAGEAAGDLPASHPSLWGNCSHLAGALSLQFSEGTVLSLPTSLVYTTLCLKSPSPPPLHSANLASFSTFRVTASWKSSLTTVPTFCPTPHQTGSPMSQPRSGHLWPQAQPHWVQSSC